MDRPDPKDPKYDDRCNLFTRDMLAWQASRPVPVVRTMPDDLLDLFTPESVEKAERRSRDFDTLSAEELDDRLRQSFESIQEVIDFLPPPPT